ncbi:AMP-binding protein [Actinospica robiniae]|uniref:AMP-binding protein n=1 Tax=Actinospica robiniae TaxID=304901 RepID=UPI000407592F|nr:AMP-binding protein [Actinospica robiniae]
MSLADLLARAAARHGARCAVELAGNELTYAELDESAGRVAAFLASHDVAVGDRVGLMLPNLTEFPALYYGALRAGAVVVPMNPLLKQREIAHYVLDSGMRLVFVFPGAMEQAVPACDGTGATIVPVEPGCLPSLLADHPAPALGVLRDADDLAVILYTSGTTGAPKGAMLTHDSLVRTAEIAAEDLLRIGPDDTLLGALPLFHVFGACAMNAAVRTGAKLSLMPRFEQGSALRAIERQRVSVLLGVPTMFAALLAARRQAGESIDTASLRVCVSGGAPFPVELFHSFESAFDCVVLEGYGMSETASLATFNHPDRPRRPGSVGTAIRGAEMRLIDVREGVGELCVRGRNVMAGYWGLEQATAEALEDGWLRTGDLARVDEDGYYYIVDRKKDLIIRGGFNVYPREIEEVLYEHPAVAEAAVLAVAHPELGEEIAAAVALRPNVRARPEELREFVRERVAPYKYPREVWLFDSLPKGPTGKILKREITAPASAR